MKKIKDINQGDIISFKADDGNYKVLICTSTYKERSPHNYSFAVLTYDKPNPPTIEEVLNCNFYGIGNRKSILYKYADKDLDKMWRIHPEVKPYYIGSYGLIIWRKDFMRFRDNIEYLGNILIVDNLDKNGSGCVNASSWNYLKNLTGINLKQTLSERSQSEYSVQSIVIS